MKSQPDNVSSLALNTVNLTVQNPSDSYCQLPVEDLGIGILSVEVLDDNGEKCAYKTFIKVTNIHTSDIICVFEAVAVRGKDSYEAANEQLNRWLGLS